MKSDLEKFQEFVKWFNELIFGKEMTEYTAVKPKRKRARKADGTYRGDDKSTPDVNEAWENE